MKNILKREYNKGKYVSQIIFHIFFILQVGNTIFRLETQFLDWKHDFQIETEIFKLETRFLDWKRDFQIGNTIFRWETRFLDWKQDFQIRNKIFRLETGSLDWKHDFYTGNKIFNFETFLVKKIFFCNSRSLYIAEFYPSILKDSLIKKFINKTITPRDTKLVETALHVRRPFLYHFQH